MCRTGIGASRLLILPADSIREVIGKGRESTEMDCFSWVNTVLGKLKNAITGTDHALDFEKYAQRYLGKFQYRINRRFYLADKFKRLVKQLSKLAN